MSVKHRLDSRSDEFKRDFLLHTIFAAEPFYSHCKHFLMPVNPAEFTNSAEAQKVLEDLSSNIITYPEIIRNLRDCLQARISPEITSYLLQTIEEGYDRLEEIARGNVKASCDQPAPSYVRRSPEYQAEIRKVANYPVVCLR